MNSKYVIRFIKAIAIQLVFIIVFSLIYYSIINDFKSVLDNHVIGYKDCVLISSTIQAGVGITNMLPLTQRSIALNVTQQVLSIMTSLYIVFTFTM